MKWIVPGLLLVFLTYTPVAHGRDQGDEAAHRTGAVQFGATPLFAFSLNREYLPCRIDPNATKEQLFL